MSVSVCTVRPLIRFPSACSTFTRKAVAVALIEHFVFGGAELAGGACHSPSSRAVNAGPVTEGTAACAEPAVIRTEVPVRAAAMRIAPAARRRYLRRGDTRIVISYA